MENKVVGATLVGIVVTFIIIAVVGGDKIMFGDEKGDARVDVIKENEEEKNIDRNKAKSTILTYTGENKGYYSVPVILKAKLEDNSGGVSDKEIEFQLGNQSVLAITNSYGIASKRLVLLQEPDHHRLRAKFAGDENYKKSTDSNLFTIKSHGCFY